jgi:hypothetical protein
MRLFLSKTRQQNAASGSFLALGRPFYNRHIRCYPRPIVGPDRADHEMIGREAFARQARRHLMVVTSLSAIPNGKKTGWARQGMPSRISS